MVSRKFQWILGSLLIALFVPKASMAQSVVDGVSLSIQSAPPKIPRYELPPQTNPKTVWTPGYWAWHSQQQDFYFVPGAWVTPPSAGMFWTPGYWGWRGSGYFYHVGFWGPSVGFYGGINYGHGYQGQGYSGGAWKEDKFVPNINKKPQFGGGAAFNGPDGITKRPSTEDLNAAQKKDRGATKEQMLQEREAQKFEGNRASKNAGIPKIAATLKVGDFSKGIAALPSE